MNHRTIALLVGLSFLLGASGKVKRLTEAEKVHYDALRVWMDAKEEKAYLKNKTEETRNQWLKDKGYWERFYQYDELTREEIVAGNVRVGWDQGMVFMGWGPPHQRRRIVREAERAETLVYRLEVTPEGRVLVWEPGSKTTHNAVERYRIELVMIDGKVEEIERKPGWD